MNGDKYFHSLWLSFLEQIWNVLSTIFFDNVNFVSYIHLPKTLSSVRVIIYKCHFGYWRWNILMPYHLLSAVPEKVKWGWSGTQNIWKLYQPAWTSVSYSRNLSFSTLQYHLSPDTPPLHYHHHPQPISNISDFILINLE